MSADEINAAIAESLGAKWYLHDSGHSWLSFKALDDHPQWTAIEKPLDLSKIVIGDSVPNYHSSLDAIVPVVRAMPHLRKKAVMHKLFVLTSNEYVSLATPAQWCEAYLKAEGLWKECKCTLRGSLIGDGCEVCNPGFAAELQKAE